MNSSEQKISDRQLHITIISIILFGPLLSYCLVGWDNANYLSFVFPITSDLVKVSFDPTHYLELNVIEIIWSLFFLKVLVIGVILLIRFFRRTNGGKLLTRFYGLMFVICIVKLALYLMYFSDNAKRFGLIIGPIIFFAWSVLLGILIHRHRTYLKSISNP